MINLYVLLLLLQKKVKIYGQIIQQYVKTNLKILKFIIKKKQTKQIKNATHIKEIMKTKKPQYY